LAYPKGKRGKGRRRTAIAKEVDSSRNRMAKEREPQKVHGGETVLRKGKKLLKRDRERWAPRGFPGEEKTVRKRTRRKGGGTFWEKKKSRGKKVELRGGGVEFTQALYNEALCLDRFSKNKEEENGFCPFSS